MKKLQLFLSLFLLSTMLSLGQMVNVTGTVSDASTSAPVPNHEVLIMAFGDSLTNPGFYFSQTVLTNANGVYLTSIPNLAPGTPVFVSTIDCAGNTQMQTVAMPPFVVDFSICTGALPCQADFYAYQDSNAIGSYVFVDISTGNPTSWMWDFGDGTASSLQNPSHVYPQPGSYPVTLTISGTNCSSTFTSIVQVTNPGACNAMFNASPSVMNNMIYQFTDVSTGNPTSWIWDFGDGSTSTDQNPTHFYTSPGNYVVTLTISGVNCSSTSISTIMVGAGACNADFYAMPDSSMTPGMLYFYDVSSGNPTSWYWDFGDGNGSTVQNPVHTYAQMGQYVVTLVILGPNCTDTTSLLVEPFDTAACAAIFTYSSTPANDLIIAFQDASLGNPTSWFWDFGDGTTSTDQNPVHTYAQAGNYTVVLAVSGSNCSSTTTSMVAAGPQPCSAYFVSYPDSNAVNSYQFVDQSTGNPTSWSWDFGDGTTSTAQNPVHAFAANGTYVVVLTISGANCSDVYTGVVQVYGQGNCNAMFSSSATPADPLMIGFLDQSTGNPTSWSWSFGDGTGSSLQHPMHTYAQPGTYTVTLTISNFTCQSTYTSVVIVGSQSCVADFAWYPDTMTSTIVYFLDYSTGNPTSWFWDFGDGTTSTDQQPTHIYTVAGSYVVTLEISGPNCSSAATQTVITSNVVNCAALFTYNPTVFNPLMVAFTDLSTGNPTSWMWDFGDGTTSTDQNPIHTYTQTGNYTVTLTITAANCTNSFTMLINLGTAGGCNADFTAYSDSVSPMLMNFVDLSTGWPYSWFWDFGDGATSMDQHPTHLYASTGLYDVVLLILGQNCVDSVSMVVSVSGTGTTVAAFSYQSSPANPFTIIFTDISIGNPTSWYWEFGDGATSTEQHPVHTYTQAGSYAVSFTVNNAFSADTETTNIIITDPNGISTLDGHMEMHVMPNPNNGTFKLEFALNVDSDLKLQIRNIQGQLVYEEQVAQTAAKEFSKSIDISNQAKGIYVIQLLGNKQNYHGKILVR